MIVIISQQVCWVFAVAYFVVLVVFVGKWAAGWVGGCGQAVEAVIAVIGLAGAGVYVINIEYGVVVVAPAFQGDVGAGFGIDGFNWTVGFVGIGGCYAVGVSCLLALVCFGVS